jgi:glycosyltransferase involved in cell wall biosynthesis
MSTVQSDEAGLPGLPAAPLFTVFTATYNRAHTIHRVYDCLCKQTLPDFEWLVIDDGSIDRTAELICAWVRVANFPIRYFKQVHSGKHIAHNRALREARGRFFAYLDSDDALLPNALEKLIRGWSTIPENEQHAFYSVGALCCDQSGKIIGDSFATDPFDADFRELRYIHRIRGEKWIVGLTDVMRCYPFPEVFGIQFIPEGMVWSNIAKSFKTRWSNEVLRIYYVDDLETGATLSKRASFGDHALGRWHYYVWLLNNDLEYFFHSPVPFLKAAVMLPIVGWSSGKSVRETVTSLNRFLAKILVRLALPFSLLLYGIGTARVKGSSL